MDDVITRWSVVEHFGIAWPDQAVHIALDEHAADRTARWPGRLCVVDQAGRRSAAQRVARDGQAEAWYIASLAPHETRQYSLVADDAAPGRPVTFRAGPETAEWRSSDFGLRLAWAAEGATRPPAPVCQWPGPIQAACGPDGIWFGAGRWDGDTVCLALRCDVIDAGPVVWRVRQVYELEGGARIELITRFDAATPAAEVTQCCTAPATGARLVWQGSQPGCFEPEQAFWRPHSPSAWRGPKAAWNRQVYPLRWAEQPDGIELTAFYNWHADGAMFWSCWPDAPGRRDTLVIGAIRPSRTRCPGACLPLAVATAQVAGERRLEFASPAQEGRKLFFIGMLDRRQALAAEGDGANGIESLYRRMHCLGLDEYHHMCLDWDGADRIAFPHLMLQPGDVEPARAAFRNWDWLRQQFEAHADDRLFLTHDQPDMRIRPGTRTLGSDWAGAYLASGDDTYARRAREAIEQRLDRWVERFAAFGPTEDELIGIGLARLWRSACIAFDFVASSAAFTPAERLACVRKFAFVAEVASTDDAWPRPESGLERGNPNFHPDFVTAKGISAALLTGHPRQPAWLDDTAAESAAFLRRYHDASGCADEAATYQFVSLACLTLLSTALRNAGRNDLFAAEPAMKRSFDYLAASQTPRDPRTGFCMLPTIGHVTGYGWCQSLQACFAWAARATAQSDPEFSRRMMDAWRRAGAMPISLHEFHSDSIWWQPLCLIDRHLPGQPQPAPAPSRLYGGLGAIFHAPRLNEDDGYLLVKMGASRGHFDPDEGSLYWYAFGRPVLADFGCQYNPNIECAWLHNRVSFDHWNEEWGHHFRVLGATTGRRVDSLLGAMTVTSLYRWGEWPIRETDFNFRLSAQRRDTPPITWRRQVLYLRDAEAVLLADDLDGGQPSDWNLQVLADEARLTGHTAHFAGQFGVDLDVYIASPAIPDLAVSGFAHLGFNEPRLPFYWWKAAQWAAPPGACYGPHDERALTLRARAGPGQGYLALLLARRRADARPDVVMLPGDAGFEWTSPAGRWSVARLPAGSRHAWRVAHSGDAGDWTECIDDGPGDGA